MPSAKRPNRVPSVLALSAALGMSLSGCRLEDAMAIAGASGQIPYAALPASSAALPYGYAPDVYDLPYAPPAPIGRLASYDDGYAWAERAYAADYAFHEAPPDYGFYYEGVQPWVWRTAANWLTFAEPFDDGYRTYYYEPEADYPYFVRDAEYGYGYDPYGRLVALYDPYGRMLPASYLYDRADEAGLYWARARALREAAEREQRMRVAEELWFARRESLARQQQSWIQAATTYDPWVAYRARTDERELRLFQDERLRREREIDRWERRQAALQRAAWERRDDGPRGWNIMNFGRQRSAEQHAINAERQAERRAKRELRVAERDAPSARMAEADRGGRQMLRQERRQERVAEARTDQRRERVVERQARREQVRAQAQERRATEVRTERLAERQARQERVRAVREQSGREQARVQRAAERQERQFHAQRTAERGQTRQQEREVRRAERAEQRPQREMRAYQVGSEVQQNGRQQQRQEQARAHGRDAGGKAENGKGGGKKD